MRWNEGLLTRRADDAAAPMPRTLAALLAGAVAIALNLAALAAADLVPLATAHGGLLRLLVMLSGDALPIPAGSAFQAGFHIVVGLAMALFYVVLEPVLRGPSWLRGLIYAVAVWLANAAVVLPATGEGFAGSRHLTLAGMVWFAAAHTLFFVVLAVLYDFARWTYIARCLTEVTSDQIHGAKQSRELIDSKIAEHRGRMVKTTGDGALVEFASAVRDRSNGGRR